MSYLAAEYDAYGNLSVSGTNSGLSFNTRAVIQSTTDGYITLKNNAGTNFSGVYLGGTTSSFPAIYKNGSSLEFRLADGSDYANLNVQTLTASTFKNLTATGTSSATALISSSDGIFRDIGGNLTNPNSNVTGSIGDVYRSSVGDGYTYHWTKQSGNNTNTGWEPTVRDGYYNMLYRPYNKREVSYFNDFTTLTGVNIPSYFEISLNLSTVGNTTVAQATPIDSNASGGQYIVSTGTTTNGWASLTYGYQILIGFYTAFRARIGFWIPTLSNSTDRYSASIGMCVGAIGISQREQLVLKYSDNVNGGRWQLSTAGGSSVIDTGVTVLAGKYYIFDYSMPKIIGGTTAISPFTATLYNLSDNVSNTFTGVTVAGNVSGAAVETGACTAFILKSAGTTSVSIQVDFMSFDAYY